METTTTTVGTTEILMETKTMEAQMEMAMETTTAMEVLMEMPMVTKTMEAQTEMAMVTEIPEL